MKAQRRQFHRSQQIAENRAGVDADPVRPNQRRSVGNVTKHDPAAGAAGRFPAQTAAGEQRRLATTLGVESLYR